MKLLERRTDDRMLHEVRDVVGDLGDGRIAAVLATGDGAAQGGGGAGR